MPAEVRNNPFAPDSSQQSGNQQPGAAQQGGYQQPGAAQQGGYQQPGAAQQGGYQRPPQGAAPQPAQQYDAAQNSSENGFSMSLAGLIVGIVGFHVVGIILSTIGFRKANKLKKAGCYRDKAKNSWIIGLIGIILSSVGLFVVIIITAVLGIGFYTAAVDGTLDEYLNESAVTISTTSTSSIGTLPGAGSSSTSGSATTQSTTTVSKLTGTSFIVPAGYTVEEDDEAGMLTILTSSGASGVIVQAMPVVAANGRYSCVFSAGDLKNLVGDDASWASETFGLQSDLEMSSMSQVQQGGRTGYACTATNATYSWDIAIFDSGAGVGYIAVIWGGPSDSAETGADMESLTDIVSTLAFSGTPSALADLKELKDTSGMFHAFYNSANGGTPIVDNKVIGLSPAQADASAAIYAIPISSDANATEDTVFQAAANFYNQQYSSYFGALDGAALSTSADLYGRTEFTMQYYTAGGGAYYVDIHVTKMSNTWYTVTVIYDAASYEAANNQAGYILSSLSPLDS